MSVREDGSTDNIFINETRARHFAASVHRAFCDVAYPDTPFVMSSRYVDPKLTKLLEGQVWWVLPPIVLYAWRVDFDALSVGPYVYFLPAYLVQSVLAHEYDLSGWTFDRLIPPSKGEVGSRFMKVASSFSAEQSKLIVQFVSDFLEDNQHVAESIEGRGQRTLEFWTSRLSGLT